MGNSDRKSKNLDSSKVIWIKYNLNGRSLKNKIVKIFSIYIRNWYLFLS